MRMRSRNSVHDRDPALLCRVIGTCRPCILSAGGGTCVDNSIHGTRLKLLIALLRPGFFTSLAASRGATQMRLR
jgi:hypothetical protein